MVEPRFPDNSPGRSEDFAEESAPSTGPDPAGAHQPTTHVTKQLLDGLLNKPQVQEGAFVAPAALRLPEVIAENLFRDLRNEIERQGVQVRMEELPPPKTGIFDGISMTLHPGLDPTQRCFIILHLFGHDVQWCSDSLRYLTDALQETDKEKFMRNLMEYEMHAGQLGLGLLRRLRGQELDQWFNDSVATDHHYVERFYEEGKLPRLEECVRMGSCTLEPLDVPPDFRPQPVKDRFAF